jgi:hypothetical protein
MLIFTYIVYLLPSLTVRDKDELDLNVDCLPENMTEI